MISTKSDSELGPELMTIRGFQWIYGIKEDPYALLLRAEDGDPRELGARVRERGRLFRSSAEVWVTAHHETATAVLADADFTVTPPPPPPEAGPDEWRIPGPHEVLPLDEVFLTLDRGAYKRLTRVVRDGIGAHFRTAATEAAEAAATRQAGGFDLLHDFALDVAVDALAAHLDVPAAARDRFARACAGCLPALDATLCPPRTPTARKLIMSAEELRTLCAELVSDRRDAPRSDLSSTIGPDGELAAAVLLGAAGVEVASVLICGTVSALLDDPAQWTLVRDDPARAGDAVREALRYASPIRMVRLFARRAVELAGQPVEEGEEVVVLTGATGHDPEAYADPERFDLNRRPSPMPPAYRDDLYGGALACFAVPAAEAAVAALAAHAPGLRRGGDAFRRLRSPVTGGMLSLPVVP
ncbi:P450-derived glycosyltransferase activator [Spirillospora sp. NBC_00431]